MELLNYTTDNTLYKFRRAWYTHYAYNSAYTWVTHDGCPGDTTLWDLIEKSLWKIPIEVDGLQVAGMKKIVLVREFIAYCLKVK